MNSENFMLEAIEQAIVGVENRAGEPFGALIAKGDKIVAAAHNQVLISRDPTAHAEIIAIRKACRQLNSTELHGCTLYTTCYPCPMCLGAALRAQVDAVVYGATLEQAANYGFNYKEMYAHLSDRDVSQMGCCKMVHMEIDGHDQPLRMWHSLPENRDSPSPVFY